MASSNYEWIFESPELSWNSRWFKT